MRTKCRENFNYTRKENFFVFNFYLKSLHEKCADVKKMLKTLDFKNEMVS